MLTKQDLKQINTIVETRIDKLATEVLLPAFADLESKMATKEDLKRLEVRMGSLEGRIANLEENMATKRELINLEMRIDEKFDYQASWLKEKFEYLTTLINQQHSNFYTAMNILYEKKIYTRHDLKRVAQR